MGSTQVAGEYNALLFATLRVAHIAFDVGRTQDMTCPLQPDTRLQVGGVDQAVPGAEGKRHHALLYQFEVLLQLLSVAPEGELEGVFQYQRKQLCGRLAADDWAFVAGGEQVRQATDMVHVYMGEQQRLEGADVEIDIEVVRACPAFGRGFGALEQAAVHQQAAVFVH